MQWKLECASAFIPELYGRKPHGNVLFQLSDIPPSALPKQVVVGSPWLSQNAPMRVSASAVGSPV